MTETLYIMCVHLRSPYLVGLGGVALPLHLDRRLSCYTRPLLGGLGQFIKALLHAHPQQALFILYTSHRTGV